MSVIIVLSKISTLVDSWNCKIKSIFYAFILFVMHIQLWHNSQRNQLKELYLTIPYDIYS